MSLRKHEERKQTDLNLTGVEPPVVQVGSDDPVLVTQDGHGVVVTINRPRVLNAMNLAVVERALKALDEGDRDVRAVAFTGTGHRAFSSGADLKARARGEALVPDPEPTGLAGRFCTKPTIAAVNGLAHGAGAELALACDMVVADRDARLPGRRCNAVSSRPAGEPSACPNKCRAKSRCACF